MEVGIFTPIGNNGWLISENSPQYMPSFDLNKEIAQKAESYGVDFLLSMIKLRGFGGKTEFWEHNLESFTLMAGLAAVTEKIRIYATCPTLVIPPAFCARMCNTIDSISHGRFGLNLITGWQRPEYSQMGLWPDTTIVHLIILALEVGYALRPELAQDVSIFIQHLVSIAEMLVSRPQAHLAIFGALPAGDEVQPETAMAD